MRKPKTLTALATATAILIAAVILATGLPGAAFLGLPSGLRAQEKPDAAAEIARLKAERDAAEIARLKAELAAAKADAEIARLKAERDKAAGPRSAGQDAAKAAREG